MSGTNEKKAGFSRRKEYDFKAQQSSKKVRTAAISVVLIVAVLFALSLYLNSKYIRRTLPAVTVDGVKFSAAEYDYFFNNAYYEYQTMVYQSMPDYAANMLPDSSRPLKSQIYDVSTGTTWSDMFSENALNKMAEIVRFSTAANAAGFEIPAEDRERLDTELEAMKESATLYGYPSFTKYLQAVFGSSMNENVLEKLAELVTLSDSYSRHIRDSYSYDNDILTAHYNEKRDSFDTYSYRYFLVRNAEVLESYYESTEEFEAAKADAISEATEIAETLAAGVNSEDDFIAAALEYDSETYEAPDSTLRHYSGDLLGTQYGDWLRESLRKSGDVTTIEITTGTYVVMFLDRSPNEYNLANMRQILIPFSSVNEADYAEDPAGYVEALNAAIASAKETADAVLAEFEEGGATEDKLIELMDEYSSDATEGGLHENIYRYQSEMNEEMNAWLLDPVRKHGDYSLFFSEASGYHLVFFTGHGDRYCDFLAENSLRDADYNAWTVSLGDSDIKTNWAFNLRAS